MTISNFQFPIIVALLPAGVISGCAASRTDLKDEAAIHYKLGVVYLNEGDSLSALKELMSAVEKDPNDANYHNALGLAY
ncbi:MAG: hypothetical protein HY878_03535, partial [Deltaproteobacteria bacterium]|nr:hypothetical protein [Deltaproteobacteria bacterium]